MADNGTIDSLSLKISSDARAAASGIDALVSKLGKLSETLGAISGTDATKTLGKVAGGLHSIASAAANIQVDKIKALNSSIKSLSTNISRLDTALGKAGFTEMEKDSGRLASIIDGHLTKVMDEFGIKGKLNVEHVKDEFEDLIQVISNGDAVLKASMQNGTYETYMQKAVEGIKYAKSFGKVANEAKEGIADHLKGTGVHAIQLDPELSGEYGRDNFAAFGAFKDRFTTKAGEGMMTLQAFVESLNEKLGLQIELSANDANQFRILADTYSGTAVNASKVDEAIRNYAIDEDKMWQSVNRLTNAIPAERRQLEQLGQTTEKIRVDNFEQLAQNMNKLSAINIPEDKIKGIYNLASAIKQLGYKITEKAIQNLPLLAKELSNLMNVLSRAPAVSNKVIKLTNALANFAQQGRGAGGAASAVNRALGTNIRQMNRTSNAGNLFTKTMKDIFGKSARQVNPLTQLASAFGRVYASLFMVFRGFSYLKQAIGYAAELTEVQNVVDVTFGQAKDKVEDFTKTSIRDFGMNRLSVKRFSSQYQAMGTAMGITGEQVKQAHSYLSNFKTPTGAINGYNKLSDSMADMSINLTKLTADLASFYDVEQSEVATKLQSGIFAGQTRPLRAFGVDLTQANLQAWALANGINADFKSMTQAEKAMIRYQYTMQRLGAAQGDYLRTSRSWANQVRLLKQQFQELGAIVGQGMIQALKPFLIAMNSALSRVIVFAEKVLNALGKIFGWKVEVSAGALDTDLSEAEGYAADLGDALGGVGDNADDAADSVKELNKQVQGFDKLNILTTSKANTGGGNGSNGSGTGSGTGTGSGSGASSTAPSIELKKVKGEFESNITDLEQLGTTIRDKLITAMDNIEWDKVYEKAGKFGKGLASFLNGLFAEDKNGKTVFSGLGKTIAGAVNTALTWSNEFAKEFNFTSFGEGVADLLVEFLLNTDWKLAGENFHNWMQGVKDAVKGFVDKLKENPDAVFKAIKDFFSEITIEDIAIFLGLVTIKKIAKWALGGGVADLASTAISGLFKNVGIAIGAKITGMTFAEASAAAGAGTLGASVLAALKSALGTMFTGMGLFLLESTGAATVGGALLTLGLPVAFGIVGHIVLRDILDKVYDRNNNPTDPNEVVDKAYKGAFGDLGYVGKDADGRYYVNSEMVLNTDVGWGTFKNAITNAFVWIANQVFAGKYLKVDKDGKITADYTVIANAKANWGEFTKAATDALTWFGGKLFGGDHVKYEDGKVTVDYTSSANVTAGWGEFIKPIKDFLTWLAETLFPSNTNYTVNGKNIKVSYTSTIDIGGAINWIGKRFNGIMDFIKQMIFGETPKTDNPVDLGNVKVKATPIVNGGKGLLLKATAELEKTTKGKKFKPTVAGMTAEFSHHKKGKKYRSVIPGMTAEFGTSNKGWRKGKSFGNVIPGMIAELGKAIAKGGKELALKFFEKARSNATGGILTASGWRNIKGYAGGGMVSSAEIFMARENGLPELVGTIGGHTAVMNNDQIVASVSAGVAAANAEQNALLMAQNALLRQLLAKETGIKSSDIFAAVRSENKSYTRRTGKSAFAF